MHIQFDLSQLLTNPSILIIGQRYVRINQVVKKIINHIKNPLTIIANRSYDVFEYMMISDYECKYIESYDERYISDLLRQPVPEPNNITSCRPIPCAASISEYLYGSVPIDSKILFVDRDSLDAYTNYTIVNDCCMCPHLTYIVAANDIDTIPSKTLQLFEYVFVFRTNDNNLIHKIYDQYGSMFVDFEAFQKVYDELTPNNGIMVIVHYPGINLKDRVYAFNLTG